MTAINDTIVAIATPPGKGGIGVVRVSGSKVKTIAKAVLAKTLSPRLAHFGFFYAQKQQVIDQGIAIFFAAPNSFTGEDVLELHAHGSPVILDQLVKCILQLGARLAEPGEFSRRAFLNNKIDLAQAEAVADLVAISSEHAVISAINSLQGKFSQQINQIVDLLIKLRTLIEASIDFDQEQIDLPTNEKIFAEIANIEQQIQRVETIAKQGVLLREGIKVVIVGKPNAGKSSLLNCLSGKDAAIVTEIAGTTRDVLREYIHLDGLPVHIVDTAGLQMSDNPIEQEGIKRTWKEIEQADEILLIADDNLMPKTNPEVLLPEFFARLQHKNKITVVKNKIDLSGKPAEVTRCGDYDVVYLSAKTDAGIDLLRELLKTKAGFVDCAEGLFTARRRHLNALQKAQGWLNAAKQVTQENQGLELIAEDLRLAQNALSEITGTFTSDDLLDKIFSSFCIGK